MNLHKKPNSLDIATMGCVQPDDATELPMEIGISSYESEDRNNPTRIHAKTTSKFRGVLDTGASCTVISAQVAKKLSLPVVGICQVSTANGLAQHNCHIVNLVFPAEITFHGHRVTSGDIGDTDFLIGMDILRRGDLSITHRHGFMIVNFVLYRPFHDPNLK